VFYADQTFGVAANPGVTTAFGLSSAGDTARLSSVDSAGNVGGYQDDASFTATDSGVTSGRYTNDVGSTRVVALQTPTPGAANSGPLLPKVVINELMLLPHDRQEYIELRNLASTVAPLYDPANPANIGCSPTVSISRSPPTLRSRLWVTHWLSPATRQPSGRKTTCPHRFPFTVPIRSLMGQMSWEQRRTGDLSRPLPPTW